MDQGCDTSENYSDEFLKLVFFLLASLRIISLAVSLLTVSKQRTKGWNARMADRRCAVWYLTIEFFQKDTFHEQKQVLNHHFQKSDYIKT